MFVGKYVNARKGAKSSSYSSHCSLHSTGSEDFSFTEVWNFSFPRAIVTKASFVPEKQSLHQKFRCELNLPCLPLMFSPFASNTEIENIKAEADMRTYSS